MEARQPHPRAARTRSSASCPWTSASPTRTTCYVYWKGATYKTCDARYIGRDVRDCHPEYSLDCLEEILRKFKAGTKDVAEGWEQKSGKVKHTRYFAVRDEDGAYRGILEVNQDVTHIRALEGDQAFPGWET